jgi:hypothetical protein
LSASYLLSCLAAIIACLGWGSLVWDPRTLPVKGPWFTDGPFIHVEFLRKSDDERVTLVLEESAPPVRSLWAVMAVNDLAKARECLRERERVFQSNQAKHIKAWSKREDGPALIVELPKWAESRGIDSVVWTALPENLGPANDQTAEKVLTHLKALTGEERDNAERYFRRAPAQVDTPIRRRVEADLGWTKRTPDL